VVSSQLVKFLIYTPKQKLTACPGKLMLGRRSVPFGCGPIFRVVEPAKNEKYARQTGFHFPRIGVKIKKCVKPPPRIHFSS